MRKSFFIFILLVFSSSSWADIFACFDKYEKLFNFGFVSISNNMSVENVWTKWELTTDRKNKKNKYQFTVKTIMDNDRYAARLDMTAPFFIAGMGLMGVYDEEYKQYFRIANNNPFKRFKGSLSGHHFLGSDILYEDFMMLDIENVDVTCGTEGGSDVVTAMINSSQRTSYKKIKLYHKDYYLNKAVFYNKSGVENRVVTFKDHKMLDKFDLPLFTLVIIKNPLEKSTTQIKLLDYVVNSDKVSKVDFILK